MSYTPINWQTGDTITAEKMNKLNPGWGMAQTQLFSETVTTVDPGAGEAGFGMAELVYASVINYPSIIVTFDGVDYSCSVNEVIDGVTTQYIYGGWGEAGPDFSVFPFAIVSYLENDQFLGNRIATQTVGSHTVVVKSTMIETSDSFRDAIFSVGAMPLLCQSGVTTRDEMLTAFSMGRLLYFYSPFSTLHFIQDISSSITFIPNDTAAITAEFDGENIFRVSEQINIM